MMQKTRLATGSAALLAVIAAMASPSVQAAEPVVKGPESVADWFNAGNTFIANGKALYNNTRRAKNVILIVGDGMGISTQTAARILEGQMKGKTGKRTACRSRPCPTRPFQRLTPGTNRPRIRHPR